MKAMVHILEFLIAVIVMISFLFMLSYQSNNLVSSPENIDEIAYDTLKGLDDQGVLRSSAVAGDYATINNKVILYNYRHDIEICDYENNCVGSRSNATNVWVGTYVISGDYTYSPHTIRLYVW